jgi:hypothetical protein
VGGDEVMEMVSVGVPTGYEAIAVVRGGLGVVGEAETTGCGGDLHVGGDAEVEERAVEVERAGWRTRSSPKRARDSSAMPGC